MLHWYHQKLFGIYVTESVRVKHDPCLFSLTGRAVACDASSSRVKRLRECLRSYVPEKQLHKVSVLHHNLLSPGSLGWQFDKVRYIRC